MAETAYTIVGSVVERHGRTVTFVIESVQPTLNPQRKPVLSSAPPLAKGQRVEVRYDRGEAQFLRIGSLYKVDLWWLGYFLSGVHIAEQACSGGTVYADGSSIDTSLWTRSWVRNSVFALTFGGVVILSATIAQRVRRDRRRRRRDTDTYPP